MIARLGEGERLAITPPGAAVERRLREETGFLSAEPDPRRLGYCGRDFRTYGRLTVAEAATLYENVAPLDRALLAHYLGTANLEPALIVRRMKRAYHRALVLALIASASPALLVVEGSDEFNEPPAARMLEEALRNAPRAIVTCEAGAAPGACSQVLALEDLAVPA